MLTIIITKRISDYHASIQDHLELWGCGRTPSEAVGQLIFYHKDEFKCINYIFK